MNTTIDRKQDKIIYNDMHQQGTSIAIGTVIGMITGISAGTIIAGIVMGLITATIGTLVHYYGIKLLDFLHRKNKKH